MCSRHTELPLLTNTYILVFTRRNMQVYINTQHLKGSMQYNILFGFPVFSNFRKRPDAYASLNWANKNASTDGCYPTGA